MEFSHHSFALLDLCFPMTRQKFPQENGTVKITPTLNFCNDLVMIFFCIFFPHSSDISEAILCDVTAADAQFLCEGLCYRNSAVTDAVHFKIRCMRSYKTNTHMKPVC